MPHRVLLIGATGTFGSRLAGLLARLPDLDLVLAARSAPGLNRLRRQLMAAGAAATISTRSIDRGRLGDLDRLGDLAPWLVVDAAGPFQGGDFRLALAAVQAGAHYIDLADARDFVAGFAAAVGPAAETAGVLAVTGASSTPALSHAALERLLAGWRRIDEVLVAISPGAQAPRGLAVMQAILSYAGRPLRVFRGGGWETAAGWSDLRRIDMPGLGRRFVSICETPDLDLLPARFAIQREALFLAGLELPLMHLGLTVLCVPVRLGLVSSLRPLARPLRAVADLLARFGTDRGGMVGLVRGQDAEGRTCQARWALWAEANAGPTVPAAPAAALVRAMAGEPGSPPARSPASTSSPWTRSWRNWLTCRSRPVSMTRGRTTRRCSGACSGAASTAFRRRSGPSMPAAAPRRFAADPSPGWGGIRCPALSVRYWACRGRGDTTSR